MTLERKGAGELCALGDGLWVPQFAGGRLCHTHLLPLALVCFGKERRNRENSARVRSRRAGENAHYPCPVCSSWHIGHRRPGSPDSAAVAERIVREVRAAGFAWYLGKLAEEWSPRYVTRDPARIWLKELTT